MGKQPNNQNWVSKGDVSPCINWFTINFSPFSDVSPRFFSLLDGLLGINDLPHFFCCRELGPGETYDLCSIMYNTLYIYCNTCIIYIDFDIIQVYIYIYDYVKNVCDGLSKCLFPVLLINRSSMRAASCLPLKNMAYLDDVKTWKFFVAFGNLPKTTGVG